MRSVSVFISIIVSRRSAVIRNSPLNREENVSSEVRDCFGLLLCFLIVGIQASGISIPLSLLTLLGYSVVWMASLTLRLYQCESPSIKFTGEGLAAGESYIFLVLFDVFLIRPPSFADVDFVEFARDLIHYAGRTTCDLSVVSDCAYALLL